MEFKAKVKDHVILVYCVGKWRPVRFYGGSKKIITNKVILKDLAHTIHLNTGKVIPEDQITFEFV